MPNCIPPIVAAWMPVGDRGNDRLCRAVVPGGRLMAGVASTRASFCWRLRVRKAALVLLSAATLVAGFWFDIAPAQAQMHDLPAASAARQAQAHSAREGRKGADAAAGDRDALRLHQQARLGGRQRADLSSGHDARGRPADLRRNGKAVARRRQRADDRARRPDHLFRRDGSERRLPRRLRRLAAPRHRRRDPDGGGARRPFRRQLHRLPLERLHRLRALQGRPQEAADSGRSRRRA